MHKKYQSILSRKSKFKMYIKSYLSLMQARTLASKLFTNFCALSGKNKTTKCTKITKLILLSALCVLSGSKTSL